MGGCVPEATVEIKTHAERGIMMVDGISVQAVDDL